MVDRILPQRCTLCNNKEPLEVSPVRRPDLFVDMTAQPFGSLVVQHFVGIAGKGNAYWCCLCFCHQGAIVSGTNLRQGKTKSCGCATNILKTRQFTTHGMSRRREYRVWADMLNRCNNPSLPNYKNYGGRGITICDSWRESFEAFYADMGDRPLGLTLERENNELGYCKENCVWATTKTQHSNKRTNHWLTFNNETLTMTQWSEKVGIELMTIQLRLKRGWSIERALTTPSLIPRKRPPFEERS